MPKGATVRSLLEDFIKKELLRRGYDPVYSPHIGRAELYETSGHFPYYRESQFPPLFGHPAGQLVDYWKQRLDADDLSEKVQKDFQAAVADLGVDLSDYPAAGSREDRLASLRKWEQQQERYLLRPMNCPHHVEIYQSQPRSYRELPVRLAEFGTVYRHEQSGELNGMLRVRGLTQDDAHLFCTAEQVEHEFSDTLDLVKFVLKSVGLDDYRIQLSQRDPGSDKYIGSPDDWDHAEGMLRNVLAGSGLEFNECEGEAAFYGPKADFMVRDCLGREWQLGTVQLDYNLPKRFQLEYIGADNAAHQPVMIHRAPFGSMERFVGMLIEHFAAAFPLWLAPEQVRILGLNDDNASLLPRDRGEVPPGRFPHHCRLPIRQRQKEDPRRATRPHPLHARRWPAGQGSGRRIRPRPHRRRPRLHDHRRRTSEAHRRTRRPHNPASRQERFLRIRRRGRGRARVLSGSRGRS